MSSALGFSNSYQGPWLPLLSLRLFPSIRGTKEQLLGASVSACSVATGLWLRHWRGRRVPSLSRVCLLATCPGILLLPLPSCVLLSAEGPGLHPRLPQHAYPNTLIPTRPSYPAPPSAHRPLPPLPPLHPFDITSAHTCQNGTPGWFSWD